MVEQRGIEPWPPHCERVSVGSTDYYTFRSIALNSTKQPSERQIEVHEFLYRLMVRPTVTSPDPL